MTERLARRAAGVTRITVDLLTYPPDPPDVDLSDLTGPELVRIARDRGLDTSGTTGELRARVADALSADYDVTED